MTQINWTESVISITSTVGSFPPYAKSVWTAIATGMNVEHFWDGTGGASSLSRGDLRPGGSRTFFAAQSASSSSGTGKLFFASNVSRLFAYGSAGTWLEGTPFFSDESTPGSDQSGGLMPSLTTCYRLRQSGSSNFNTGGASYITFPVPYISPPRVFCTSSNTSFIVRCNGGASGAVSPYVSAQSFVPLVSTLTFVTLAGPTVQVVWEAIGYVSSASF